MVARCGGDQFAGARGVSKTTGVAPVTLPMRALRCTYSFTSCSKVSAPSTRALGPMMMRGGSYLMRRLTMVMPLLPLGLRTVKPPRTCEPMPTVTSPV